MCTNQHIINYMKTYLGGRTGFTVVELLIVIVVIAILASIGMVAYTGMREKAMDSKIESELAQLNKRIELTKARYSNAAAMYEELRKVNTPGEFREFFKLSDFGDKVIVGVVHTGFSDWGGEIGICSTWVSDNGVCYADIDTNGEPPKDKLVINFIHYQDISSSDRDYIYITYWSHSKKRYASKFYLGSS